MVNVMGNNMGKKIIQFCLGLFVIIVGVFVVVFHQGYKFWLNNPPKDATEYVFTVDSGESFRLIADRLEEEGIIANSFWFTVYAKFAGIASSVQAGEFVIFPGDDYASIGRILLNAKTEEVQVTIPEGYTLKQMGEVLAEKFDFTEADWAIVTGMESPLEDHPFITRAGKPENVDLEGYLFPSTYRFFAESTAEDIATIMLEQMEEEVDALTLTLTTDEIIDTPHSIHEMLTLASIVEREVRKPDEMKTIAGIFYNRLEIGMPLQSDATVNYITGGIDPSISLADTQLDSLYNTYKYAGLPPGPISNPGHNALIATASPAQTDYYYFLTSDDGTVYYGETYDQHLDNKARYLD